MNKKGFVLEGTLVIWAIVALTIGAVTFFQGPNLVKAVTGSDRNQAKQTLKSSESYPIGHLDPQGRFVKMGDYNKKLETLNLTTEKPPETLWEKFWHMTWIVIIVFMVLGGALVYLFGWPKVKTWISDLKAKLVKAEDEKAALHDDAKLIVQSVDAGLQTLKDAKAAADAIISTTGVDATVKATQQAVSLALDQARTDFLTAMDGVQDTSTKALVHDLLKND